TFCSDGVACFIKFLDLFGGAGVQNQGPTLSIFPWWQHKIQLFVVCIENEIERIINHGLTFWTKRMDTATVQVNSEGFCICRVPMFFRHFCTIRQIPFYILKPNTFDWLSLEP